MRIRPEIVGADPAGEVGVVPAGIADPAAAAEATVAVEAVRVALSTMAVENAVVVEGNDGKSDYTGPVRS